MPIVLLLDLLEERSNSGDALLIPPRGFELPGWLGVDNPTWGELVPATALLSELEFTQSDGRVDHIWQEGQM